jgi:hypothetical protein
MLAFDLNIVYPALSSDEGPPFGKAGVSFEEWPDFARVLRGNLIRPN